MIVTYFRSSSYNAYDMCQLRYYIEYVLGWKGKSNKSADKGTIVHKVLEILAARKRGKQNGDSFIEDDILGQVSTKFLNLDKLIEDVWNHYTNHFNNHKWSTYDYTECKKWVNGALNFNSGAYDPRLRNIVQEEKHFDFLFEEDWAKFSYEIEGNKVEGSLGLKGTVDLITEISPTCYEIIDWKTGQRKNWATGSRKEYTDLEKDPQLRLYHYAVHKMFPHVNQVMVTIFFIKDGGPFTLYFDDSDLVRTEQMIKDRFNEVKNNIRPSHRKGDDPCKFCSYAKETYADKGVEVMEEFREGQICEKGTTMTMCEQTDLMIDLYGMDYVTSKMKHPYSEIGHYKAPGSIE